MKHIIHSDTTVLGFQIAPMVDVVFVIMLFFMVMTGTVKVERELITKLPKSGDPLHALELDEITIGVLEDGTVTMNGEEFDSPRDKTLPALTKTLRRLTAASSREQQSVLVTIQAEEQASYERIINVLNSLHQAQIQNVTFTVAAQTL